jgi:uncharacterized protein (TIGR03643 family)
MGISRALKEKVKAFTADDKERLIRMGWEDRTSFDAIEAQFGLTPNDFVRFMRSELDRKTFDRWRQRANERGQLKHERKSGGKATRFKCPEQTTEGRVKNRK